LNSHSYESSRESESHSYGYSPDRRHTLPVARKDKPSEVVLVRPGVALLLEQPANGGGRSAGLLLRSALSGGHLPEPAERHGEDVGVVVLHRAPIVAGMF
jgi:hypothetical protein